MLPRKLLEKLNCNKAGQTLLKQLREKHWNKASGRLKQPDTAPLWLIPGLLKCWKESPTIECIHFCSKVSARYRPALLVVGWSLARSLLPQITTNKRLRCDGNDGSHHYHYYCHGFHGSESKGCTIPPNGIIFSMSKFAEIQLNWIALISAGSSGSRCRLGAPTTLYYSVSVSQSRSTNKV